MLPLLRLNRKLNIADQEIHKSSGAGPKLFYGYVIVIGAFIIMVLSWGTLFSFGIFFKPLLTEFGWTRAMTSGAYTLSSLLRGILSIVTGRLSDKFGLRIVVTVCGLFLGLGYLLLSQTSTIWDLYLFYGFIVAAGIAGFWAPLIAAVARWFVKRRGMMSGIVTSGVSVGTMIIPLIVARLISGYGWRTSYIIIGIVCLVLIILVAQFLRRDPRQMGLLPYGANEVKQEGSVAEGRGLSFQEAIHTRQFWINCAAYFCYGYFAHTIEVHIVPHATELGISPIRAANIIAIIGGLGIFGRLIMGSASERIGIKSALIFVFALASIILLWLQVAKELWMLYLFAVIFGFAYGGLSALQPLIIVELFGLSSLGTIVGSFTFSFTTGSAVGVFLAGYTFDVTGSYFLAFFSCAALGIVGLVFMVLLKPIRGKGEQNQVSSPQGISQV